MLLMDKTDKYLLIKVSVSSLFLIVCFWAGIKYDGNIFYYVSFCIAFFLMLVDVCRGEKFYSYLFLVIFLFLGFWCKFVLHLIFPYPYMEPVGQFDYMPHSWDSVLAVSSIGVMGVVFAKNVFFNFFNSVSKISEENYAPDWYRRYRSGIVFVVFLIIFLVPLGNIYFGIAQAGLIPSVKLPWPWKGLIAWCVGFGLAVMVATIIYWDQSLNKNLKTGFALVILEGFFSTISSLSRAAYIFHTVPALFIFLKDNLLKKWYLKISVIFTWFLFLSASLVVVMMLRYSDLSPIDATNGKKFNMQSSEVASELTRRVSRLVVDRWIGMEGVMAVVSYQSRGTSLFYEALTERRVTGKVDIYTDKIAQAGLTDSDLKKFQYATIPGAIAFFYYSNSYTVLFLGIFFLVMLMMFLEMASFRLTRNKYITAFWGMGAAQAVASFGLGLPQQLVYYSVCFASMGAVYLLQKYSRPAFND